MTYFMTITKETTTEELAKLFRNNMQKLYRLPENIILDKKLQFVTRLTKKLNRMLEIETKLSTSFDLQTDRQTKYINQELEQYLQFFVKILNKRTSQNGQ